MTIPDIKTQLTITQVLDYYNYKPTGKGILKCPFHENGSTKKKTFQVYTDTNRYQCFHKECTAGNGDVIDFIEKQENCTKHQAIEKAKTLINPTAKETKEAHSDNYSRGDENVGEHRLSETQKSETNGGVFSVQHEAQMHYIDQDLDITVLGGISIAGLDRMRCTLKLISTAQPHITGLRHTLDLYNDDQLQKLVRKTAERLEIGTSKITTALYNLTDRLEQYRLAEIQKNQDKQPKIDPITEAREKRAKNLLSAPKLMRHTNDLLGQSGIIGESKNRQTLYLVYGSRKREKPLHVICLGASGTGKTYLQEMVARFIPESEKFTFTASSENAFYYLEPYDLCHKVVLIEDMDGVQYLLYTLRELQTKKWICKIVPVKDAQGVMKTKKIEVFGPICLSGTTTKERLYEDNANRCLLLHLDDSVEQEENIMAYQRKISAGKVDTNTEDEAIELLQDIQRILQPIKVINPFAEVLKIPLRCFKPLRTNQHYIDFIETVTWYHQFQRKEQVDKETGEVFIETTLEDIEVANELMKEVLLTKSDELPKAIRDFFEQLKVWLKEEDISSFYSKKMRAYFRLYPMKANRYIKTLLQYGFLKKAGGNKKSGYEYEVADWNEYDNLKSDLNILDELLENLKKGSK